MRSHPRFAKPLAALLSLGGLSWIIDPAASATIVPIHHRAPAHHHRATAHHHRTTVRRATSERRSARHNPRPRTKTVRAVVAVPQPAGGVWHQLRMCESAGNYHENTGNGYYGAYQFSLSTWHSIGGVGRPDDATVAVQDALARRLQSTSGWGNWPQCSWELGL